MNDPNGAVVSLLLADTTLPSGWTYLVAELTVSLSLYVKFLVPVKSYSPRTLKWVTHLSGSLSYFQIRKMYT